MDAREIIGWNLRALRVAAGLSQERLALAAGIDRSYVGRVERGSENVTITTLDAMATVLAVPIARLLAEPDAQATKPAALPSGRKPKGERPKGAGAKNDAASERAERPTEAPEGSSS